MNTGRRARREKTRCGSTFPGAQSLVDKIITITSVKGKAYDPDVDFKGRSARWVQNGSVLRASLCCVTFGPSHSGVGPVSPPLARGMARDLLWPVGCRESYAVPDPGPASRGFVTSATTMRASPGEPAAAETARGAQRSPAGGPASTPACQLTTASGASPPEISRAWASLEELSVCPSGL